MEASIIVCTYNRAESLRETLGALRAQRSAPSLSWEVIIVDNNSKDHTRKVIQDLQSDWPLLRYEFENQQGLSHARNRGISCAQGEVLLFTDDDVLPEPDWLETTLDGLAKYRADACGGYIAPIWETPPPGWLTERFYGFLAIKTDTTERQITSTSDTPFGANMAFRRELFAKYGVFDVTRGRMGNILASGEDGELFERILDGGGKIMYFPRARVHHRVEAFRVGKAYFRRWRFQTSRNLAISRDVQGRRRIFNIPPYLISQTLRALWRAAWGRFTAPADEAFNREIVVWHFLGTLQGLWQSHNK